MEFNVKIVEAFLSLDECQKIVSFLETIEEWERSLQPGSWWDNRSLSDYTIYNKLNKEIGRRLVSIKYEIAEVIKSHYNLDTIYPDLLSISRWFPGMEQTPHADDMTNSLPEETNVHKHREYGSIIYLNNNFSGGKTYYPDHGLEVTPNPGTLVIHPANPQHLHGVSKIDENVRYTISSFWSKNKDKYNSWDLTYF